MIEAALDIHWQRARRRSPRDQAESALECPLAYPFSCCLSARGRGEDARGLLVTGHALIRLQERGPDARMPPGGSASRPCTSRHWVSNASPTGSSRRPQDPSPSGRGTCLGSRRGEPWLSRLLLFPRWVESQPASAKETTQKAAAPGQGRDGRGTAAAT